MSAVGSIVTATERVWKQKTKQEAAYKAFLSNGWRRLDNSKEFLSLKEDLMAAAKYSTTNVVGSPSKI